MKMFNDKTTSVEFTVSSEAMDALREKATENDIHHICEVFGALIVMEQMFAPWEKQGKESNFAVATCRKNLDFVLKTICNGWKLNVVDTYFAADKILKRAIEHFGVTMGTEEENK